jgi:hypothetical protein
MWTPDTPERVAVEDWRIDIHPGAMARDELSSAAEPSEDIGAVFGNVTWSVPMQLSERGCTRWDVGRQINLDKPAGGPTDAFCLGQPEPNVVLGIVLARRLTHLLSRVAEPRLLAPVLPTAAHTHGTGFTNRVGRRA